MSVVQYETPTPLPPSLPGQELEQGAVGDVARLRAAAEYAGHIAGTAFVPEQLRGNAPSVSAAILAGGELGLRPITALRAIVIVKGRVGLYAEAQRALVYSAGHELWFEETTATRAIAVGRRAGTDRVGRITWTLDDAKRARIAGGENWTKYPAAMLRARASADLCRAMFADVVLGIPAVEEIDELGENGPVVQDAPTPPAPGDAGAAPAAPRRRQRKRAGAAPLPPAPPTPDPDAAPAPETPAVDPPATGARKRQIFALMRDVGMGTGDTERELRLDYVRRVIERPELASSNELTQSESLRVIDDLSVIKALPADERRARITAAGTAEGPVDGQPEGDTAGPPGGQETSEAGGSEAPPDDDIPF